MPPTDAIHTAVKAALIKDGWTITADPYTIQYEEVTLFADLGAERPVAAERGGEKIVVEAKSFLSPSPIQDLKVALGQYEIYRLILETTAPDRRLFLAIGDRVFGTFFQQKAIQHIIRHYNVLLVVVDLQSEEVLKWTS